MDTFNDLIINFATISFDFSFVLMPDDVNLSQEINGTLRETRELIPEEAFREAIANAIIHRRWDLNAHIRMASLCDNQRKWSRD